MFFFLMELYLYYHDIIEIKINPAIYNITLYDLEYEKLILL